MEKNFVEGSAHFKSTFVGEMEHSGQIRSLPMLPSVALRNPCGELAKLIFPVSGGSPNTVCVKFRGITC